MNPVDTAPLIAEISKAGALESFMLLVIVALSCYVLYLNKDASAERKENREINKAVGETLAGVKELMNVLIHKKD